MKKTVAVFLLIAIPLCIANLPYLFFSCINCIPLSCGTSERYVEELKQCIPDLKKLVSENEEVFMEILALSEQNRKFRYYSVFLDSTRNDAITVCEYPVGNAASGEDISLGNSELFTPEEKTLIRLMFSLSQNEVKVEMFGSGNGFSLRPFKDRVTFELLYGEKESDVAYRTGMSAFWEEILDNWYVVIITNESALGLP